MISREKKESVVSDMRAQFAASQALIVAENKGLNASQMADLRRRLKAFGGHARVVKNTLAQKALADGEFAVLRETLRGPLIYGFGGDPSGLAKTFTDTAKDNEKFIIRGAALPGNLAMDAAGIKLLAALPGRDQLLSTLAATLQAPSATFARLLNEIPASFARVLQAVAKQKIQ